MNTVEWAVTNIQLPKGAKWDFSDRKWQLDILNDTSKKIVCRKPTQVGMSTVFLIKMLHFADENVCRLLYTLPRQDDVYDMVNSRLHDIVTESPYVRTAISEVDNVRMKKFKKSWLHFIEMSAPPRMLDVDWMVNDEVDLSNQNNLQQAVSRLDASKYNIHHQISTPTIEGYGIDALYEISDKKQWFVQCGYCNYRQTLDWNINVEFSSDPHYKCSKCGRKIYPEDIRDGEWVATGSSKSDISGYQISQLMIPSISLKKLIREYRDIDRKTFYNFRLGLPYRHETASFDKMQLESMISSNVLKENQRKEEGTYVLGCDQGNTLHYCVMRVTKSGTSEVVLFGTTEDFDDVAKIARRFNITCGVLDALPNHHTAMGIANAIPKIRLAFFGNAEKIYITKDQRIYINKTDGYDMLLQKCINGEFQFYNSPETILAISHLCNMRRDIKTQMSRIGGTLSFHTWDNVGPDHYADSLLYAMIAADIITAKGRLEFIEITGANTTNRINLYTLQNQETYVPSIPGLPDSEPRLISHGLYPDNPYIHRQRT